MGKKLFNAVKNNHFLLYSFWFAVLAFVLYGVSFALAGGATLVNSVDVENQYILALIYYSEHLKTIASHLIHDHILSIPEWEFAVGEGADIVGTFSYYSLGSPLALLSVFFKASNMYICYGFIVIARLYFAGMAFMLLCREKIENMTALQAVTGALLYAFSGWGIENSLIWYNFLIPSLYLPLMLFGIERIFNNKSSVWLIVSSMLLAVSNLYFFYMCGLIAAGHVVLRLFFMYKKDVRRILRQGLKILCSVLLGLLMSMVTFLPTLAAYLNNPRVGEKQVFPAIQDLAFFTGFPGRLLRSDAGYGVVCITLLAAVVLFKKKGEHFLLKAYVVLAFVMLSFPVFGSIMNGFSYAADRWTFALPLLFAYILTVVWKDMTGRFSYFSKTVFITLLLCFGLMVLFHESRELTAFFSLGLALCVVYILSSGVFPDRYNEYVIFACGILCIVLCFRYSVSPDERDAIDSMLKAENYYYALNDNESKAVAVVAEADRNAGSGGFFRYSGDNLKENSGLLRRLSSTTFYWSNVSPYSWAFRNNIANFTRRTYDYKNYDERTVANAISSVKYYLSNKERVPYGFSLAGTVNVKEEEELKKLEELKAELWTRELSSKQANPVKNVVEKNYDVYRNDYSLPLGFTYDSFVPHEDYMLFDAPEREWTMLDSVVLSDYENNAHAMKKGGKAGEKLKSEIKNMGEEVLVNGNEYLATEQGSFDVEFEGRKNSEVYLYVKGLQFEAIDDYERYFGLDSKNDPFRVYNRTNFKLLKNIDKLGIIREHFMNSKADRETASLKITGEDGTERTLIYYMPSSRMYSGCHDFVINLGYSEEAMNSVHVAFGDKGKYTIDEICVYSYSMDEYPQKIAALKEDVLENENIGEDTVTGTISLDRPKFLYLSVPFAEGWRAYDNGQEVRLYRANDMYMAMELSEGEHEIRLLYKTPFLREGALLSFMGLLIFAAYLIALRRKNIMNTR